MQMRDLSREQNPKQKGTLPSDTIANPKGSRSGPASHIIAITTQSGKVLQGGSEQVVELEEPEHEVEVEEPSVVEVEKVPEDLKVQEENREEVKEKVKEIPKTIPPIPRPSPPFPQRLARKKEDSGAFTIPCTIGAHDIARALCDNGASINLMPLAIYKQAGLGTPRPTSMRLQMVDCSIKKPVGIIDDVLVKVGKFHLPADFVILDCAVEKEIPIILGRPFLATGKALMDLERNEIKFCINDEEVTFQASKGMKLLYEYESISVIDVVDKVKDAVEMKMEEQCLGEALAPILVNFDGEDMEGYMESVNALEWLGSYTYAPAKLSLDLENRATPPVEQLLDVLKEHRKAIGWTIADIRGIPAGICEHKIQLENKTKPSRMLFGLCNAPATFQRCMMSIFSDMVEDFLEVFMDDFSVVGDSFEHFLNNLRQVLKRCEETNLVLNWEKCHFMVDEGIVLGHKISKHGIEVDRAKIEIISKLPPPTSGKGVQSFLGHAGFYRRFIKDFSKIANPICKLLEKDVKFMFDEKCLKAFEEFKQNLTSTPIIVTPDWSLPFELICDASGVSIGAVLSQRHNKVLHPVYYASKTLNGAQMNYTVTEQELLAIIYDSGLTCWDPR
uniref:Retrovirus-related Pol polyprotein from transposon 17.6 n=1 Tax=Nicotiana tabacum TaxID=4097 RepID=A0A1S4BP82_TOBAC|nr:PREDICTED: uncharacterized protein LOC107810438 [Nicotiana tabacum]